MKSDELLKRVMVLGKTDSDGEARCALRVTLQTLSDRLRPEARKNLAAQLPAEIAECLHTSPGVDHVERISIEAFYLNISSQLEVPVADAKRFAHAVMQALQEAVSEGEIDKLKAQLPEDYRVLFEPSQTITERRVSISIEISGS